MHMQPPGSNMAPVSFVYLSNAQLLDSPSTTLPSVRHVFSHRIIDRRLTELSLLQQRPGNPLMVIRDAQGREHVFYSQNDFDRAAWQSAIRGEKVTPTVESRTCFVYGDATTVLRIDSREQLAVWKPWQDTDEVARLEAERAREWKLKEEARLQAELEQQLGAEMAAREQERLARESEEEQRREQERLAALRQIHELRERLERERQELERALADSLTQSDPLTRSDSLESSAPEPPPRPDLHAPPIPPRDDVLPARTMAAAETGLLQQQESRVSDDQQDQLERQRTQQLLLEQTLEENRRLLEQVEARRRAEEQQQHQERQRQSDEEEAIRRKLELERDAMRAELEAKYQRELEQAQAAHMNRWRQEYEQQENQRLLHWLDENPGWGEYYRSIGITEEELADPNVIKQLIKQTGDFVLAAKREQQLRGAATDEPAVPTSAAPPSANDGAASPVPPRLPPPPLPTASLSSVPQRPAIGSSMANEIASFKFQPRRQNTNDSSSAAAVARPNDLIDTAKSELASLLSRQMAVFREKLRADKLDDTAEGDEEASWE